MINIYNDSYTELGSQYTGVISINTGVYPNYTMDKIAIASMPSGTGFLVKDTDGVYSVCDRNKIAIPTSAPESLSVTTGVSTFALYDTTGNLMETGEYTISGNNLYFNTKSVQFSGNYVYDIDVSVDSETSVAGAACYSYEFWKGGSLAFVQTGSGELRLDLAAGDYRELSVMSRIGCGTIEARKQLNLTNQTVEPILTNLSSAVWE